MTFVPIEEAIEEIARGRMVVVVDDQDRENEGDLVMAAEQVTPETVNFMAKNARGLICVPLTASRLQELGVPMMVSDNTSSHETAFGVSVDLKGPGRTGISAFDRAATISALCDPSTKPSDLGRPGHVFPLRARDGGVLRRAGHTEAAVDMARMAGLQPAGVLCEIMNDDGSMARLPELSAFAQKHGLKIATIADLIAYRSRSETLVQRVAKATLPTPYGVFDVVAYQSLVDGREYVAFVQGDVSQKGCLVRVHSQCLTGDVFGSVRCDCQEQLHIALEAISAESKGVLLYVMAHEGRGIGISHKIRAYGLQDEGLDTVEANLELGFAPDMRDYGIGAQVLVDLGVKSMRLMTNNPHKYAGLEGHGLIVEERVPLNVTATPENLRYLRTKREKLGHLIEGLGDS